MQVLHDDKPGKPGKVKWLDHTESQFLYYHYGLEETELISFELYNKTLNGTLILTEKADLLIQSGECVTIVFYHHLGLWVSRRIPCNISREIELYCALFQQRNLSAGHMLSDMVIQQSEKQFYTLSHESACPKTWIRSENKCLKIQLCSTICQYNHTYIDICNKGRLARNIITEPLLQDFLYNASDKVLDEGSVIVKFLSLFRQSRRINYYSKENISIAFDPYTCISLGKEMKTDKNCQMNSYISVTTYKSPYVKEKKVWGITEAVHVVHLPNSKPDFVLCEMSPQKAVPTECAEYFFTCSDGTCISDELVCDGTSHCINDEDEKNCAYVCDHNIDCIKTCSYSMNCRCMRGYFQCLSGGCIPVGKLSDGIAQCKRCFR